MKKRLFNYDDVPLWLGDEKAEEVMSMEEGLLRKHPHCFDNYSALDVMNVALCLTDLLRNPRGKCEAMDLLRRVRRTPTWEEADAFRRGELVLRLGGMEACDVLCDYLLALCRLLTRGERLPAWACELLQVEGECSPEVQIYGLRGSQVVIVQAGGSFFDVHDNTNIAF